MLYSLSQGDTLGNEWETGLGDKTGSYTSDLS